MLEDEHTPRTNRDDEPYVAPKRRDKRQMTTFVEPRFYKAIHEIARQKDKTVGDILLSAVHQYVNRYGPKNG